jgi:hypothetical protein
MEWLLKDRLTSAMKQSSSLLEVDEVFKKFLVYGTRTFINLFTKV